jgi:hypothetical protein
MEIDFQYAPWGMFFATVMYVVGNAVWINHIVRKRVWIGWLLWLVSGLLFLVAGAAVEVHLNSSSIGVWKQLRSYDPTNHWIIMTFYALLSFPGAASVMLRQNMAWTRFTVLAPAIIVLLPVGEQLGNPENNYLMLSIGMTLATCSILWIWQSLLDCEPTPKPRVKEAT